MEQLKSVGTFLSDILKGRKMIFSLAKNDFRAKFASSFLGAVWAFIQPLITILVFWFVFQVGFKNPPVSNVPFVVWFTPAYLVWAFFSETLISGANCLVEYSYLVKKVNFRVSLIPIVKIISSAFVHVVFILFIFSLLLFYHIPLSAYNLQVLYYFLCTCGLLLGLCWLLSALAPFVRDTTNIVGVFIQIGFWLTPIFWSPETMDPWVQNVLMFNPMFYICQGYRDAFVDGVWFWQHDIATLIFWMETVALFFVGAYLFRKLRPQFADVL